MKLKALQAYGHAEDKVGHLDKYTLPEISCAEEMRNTFGIVRRFIRVTLEERER